VSFETTAASVVTSYSMSGFEESAKFLRVDVDELPRPRTLVAIFRNSWLERTELREPSSGHQSLNTRLGQAQDLGDTLLREAQPSQRDNRLLPCRI
jgi:hypothetical protein